MRNNARQWNFNCRAFFCLVPLLLAPWAGAFGDVTGLRGAAIMVTEKGSRALIETRDGEQHWYRAGDQLAAGTIEAVTEAEVVLQAANGRYHLPLRGDPVAVSEAASEPSVPPSRHQFREFQVLALLSEINSVDPGPGESYEAAAARTLNSALGLGGNARITAVGRVQVATAEEARRELQRQLGQAEADPVRLTLENDYLKDMYVMPQ